MSLKSILTTAVISLATTIAFETYKSRSGKG